MGPRRAAALALIAAALTTMVVIYDSAPGSGAKHSLNPLFMVLSAVVLAVGVAWFILDARLMRWYHDRWGIPYPAMTCNFEGGKVILTLRNLARFGMALNCRVVLPDRRHVESYDMKRDGLPGDERRLTLPDDFEYLDSKPVELVPGRYRVIWRSLQHRGGNAEPLAETYRTGFRIK